MKELKMSNDELPRMLRDRLGEARLTVREGFWETLTEDLKALEAGGDVRMGGPVSHALRPTPWLPRMAAAAAVVLMLAGASATFWYFSPKEEIKDAFTQVAVMAPATQPDGDQVTVNLPQLATAEPVIDRPNSAIPVPASPRQEEAEEEHVSIRLSITISERQYEGHPAQENGYSQTGGIGQSRTSGTSGDDTPSQTASTDATDEGRTSLARPWAVKAALGTALPKGDWKVPLTLSATLERQLTQRLSLEAGLRYDRLPSSEGTVHTLAIPLRLNCLLAEGARLDLYATAGGMAERSIAGAETLRGSDPVRLSLLAGLGLRYKLTDRFALFAEPTVSHHFGASSSARSLHSERPTNFNLACGLRMTY